MSATRHGVACHCGKCHKYNLLSGRAFNLSKLVLEAHKARQEEKEQSLLRQLEEVNAEASRLKEELGR